MDDNSWEQISQKMVADSCSITSDKVQKITLTSRTLGSKIDKDYKSFEEVCHFIDQFEKFVMNGFLDLRKIINGFGKDFDAKEESYNKQISMMEDFKAEKESLQNRNIKLEEELTEAKNKLTDTLSNNQCMIGKLAKMELKHKTYLESVAVNYRERIVAKKVIEKWKHKVAGRSKANLMKQENQYLRRELRHCQTDAKKAFLRSANTINNEALSMFQSAANRRLYREQGAASADESFASTSCSTIASDVWSDGSRGSENSARREMPSDGRLLAADKRPQSGKRKCTANDKENSHRTDEDSRSYVRFRDACKSPTTAYKQKATSEPGKSTTRKNVSLARPCDAMDACRNRAARVPVCRCQPSSATSERCPRCPVKSFNFAHMPVTKKPSVHSAKQRNIAIATIRDKEKANVMYNPTGIAVVIEKHVSY